MDLRRLNEGAPRSQDGERARAGEIGDGRSEEVGEEKTGEEAEMAESGVRVRNTARGVARRSGLRLGSNGEAEGDAKGVEEDAEAKVNARGVGEMMESVGGSGASVVTSRVEAVGRSTAVSDLRLDVQSRWRCSLRACVR